jgi:hypothetical protein
MFSVLPKTKKTKNSNMKHDEPNYLVMDTNPQDGGAEHEVIEEPKKKKALMNWYIPMHRDTLIKAM